MVIMGNVDGTFQSPVSFSVGEPAQSLVVGDFNGDGKPDLGVTTANAVAVLLNTCASAAAGETASPEVTVTAGDPNASEYFNESSTLHDWGAFRVTRSGDTSGNLTIDYTLGGTAV